MAGGLAVTIGLSTDLSLRRSVDRTRTGKEPLEVYAVSAKVALDAYETQHADEDAPSAYVLDFAAMEANPDGNSCNASEGHARA